MDLGEEYHRSDQVILLSALNGSCCCSVAKLCWLFVTPWTAACQASLSFIISQNLLKLMSIELVVPSNHLILYRPLLLLPSIFPSLSLPIFQGLFQWVSSSHQVAKILEFQLQHQSFQWIVSSGWISLQSKGLSRVFSNTTVQKHQFFGAQLSL